MNDRERIAELRASVERDDDMGKDVLVADMLEALDGWERALDETHNWHNKADGWLEVARKAEDERDEARELVKRLRKELRAAQNDLIHLNAVNQAEMVGRVAVEAEAKLREWGMA